MEKQKVLREAYKLLSKEVQFLGKIPRISQTYFVERFLRMPGVYVMFEEGELRSGSGEGLRVVRIGRTKKQTLSKRLSLHTKGGHRASVLRKHIGMALMKKNPELFVETWGGTKEPPQLKQNPVLRQREKQLEENVTRYIEKHFLFLPLVVQDYNTREILERELTALFSNYYESVDPPSAGWLGRWTEDDKIVRSGIWNVHNVDMYGDWKLALELLEKAINETLNLRSW